MGTAGEFYIYKETMKDNSITNTQYNLTKFSKPFFKVKVI
jgi:hypothetical protein